MSPRDSQKQALEAAVKELDRRIAANRLALTKAQSDRNQKVVDASRSVSKVEAKAASKQSEEVSSAGGMVGCGTAAAGFFGLAFVIGYSTSGGAIQYGTGMFGTLALICLGIVVLGLLLKSLPKMEARSIRSELPAVMRNLELVKAESEARLNSETALIEAELHRLKHEKMQCQHALTELC